MIIPAGTPETSLLRGLFLGLSTLGESNLGPGGVFDQRDPIRDPREDFGSGCDATLA